MYSCAVNDLLACPDVADSGIFLEAVQYGGLWLLDILFHTNRSWRPMHEVIPHGTLQSPMQRGLVYESHAPKGSQICASRSNGMQNMFCHTFSHGGTGNSAIQGDRVI